MISLIYQHYGPYDQLLKCIQNLHDKIVEKDLFSVSLVYDGKCNDEEYNEITYTMQSLKCKWVFTDLGCHRGLTVARNLAAANAIEEFNPIKLIFCSTNNNFCVDLDKDLYNKLINTSNLTAIPYECDDWVYERNFFCEQFPILPIDYFLSVQNKPDYVMMVDTCVYIRDKEFDGEIYNPEDVSWLMWADDGKITMFPEKIQVGWFNKTGMTRTGLKDWRKVEINNSLGFYQKAEYFLDSFLEGKVVLNIRQLKDYTATLINNHKNPIPLKKYKGTVIEPLMIERLLSWSQNENFENNFGIIKENDYE